MVVEVLGRALRVPGAPDEGKVPGVRTEDLPVKRMEAEAEGKQNPKMPEAGPSTPGPSTMGPSTPGPSTMGPSTPRPPSRPPLHGAASAR